MKKMTNKYNIKDKEVATVLSKIESYVSRELKESELSEFLLDMHRLKEYIVVLENSKNSTETTMVDTGIETTQAFGHTVNTLKYFKDFYINSEEIDYLKNSCMSIRSVLEASRNEPEHVLTIEKMRKLGFKIVANNDDDFMVMPVIVLYSLEENTEIISIQRHKINGEYKNHKVMTVADARSKLINKPEKYTLRGYNYAKQQDGSFHIGALDITLFALRYAV